ncbi:phosphotransferase enzyme family protein [Histoplasma capsulatum G186AR]|uniref:Phosphotransferase enzyme family protein n=1 Tax=Ajellomyces capsulatus (strain G186AR / H82 / ATCC MYA-2454 / RMSCC 2432) TaxID=447093 RepID=C0NI09_AJECG|nr:phosphotransferase enzyme family protein [Histoplasma capsulatum G186AR]EEH09444.1 phosphotransferase enzyme family protein [Histoplasma capsulatum G186AR]
MDFRRPDFKVVARKQPATKYDIIWPTIKLSNGHTIVMIRQIHMVELNNQIQMSRQRKKTTHLLALASAAATRLEQISSSAKPTLRVTSTWMNAGINAWEIRELHHLEIERESLFVQGNVMLGMNIIRISSSTIARFSSNQKSVGLKGREVVIGKVPNPNTGIRHHQLVYWYYALQILPPQVYAWNSRVDGNNLVSAESIVMIKCKVYPSPKSRSVSAARLDQNMFAIFSNSEIKGDCSQILSFRNLHYCKDIELAMPRTQLHVDEAEQLVDSSQFARGPAVSRE